MKVKGIVPDNILALARIVGCPVWPRSEGDSYSFNGRTIASHQYDGSPRLVRNIIHDIAHYIVCPKRYRSEVEFGLGNSPDIGTKPAPYMAGRNRCSMTEESWASMLGILIERQLGMKWKETWLDHNWDQNAEPNQLAWGSPEIKKVIDLLRRRKWINDGLKVKILEKI